MSGAGAGPKCQVEIGPLANSFFPTGHAARTVASNLDSACRARDQDNTTLLAYSVLGHVESFLNGGGSGNPGNGSLLVNGLISCISTLCTSAGRPGINFAPSLSPAGMFGFRYGATDGDMVVARGPTSFPGNGLALWGVEVPDPAKPWSVANNSPWTIVYGSPVTDNPLTLVDESIGGLQYDIKRHPRFGHFSEDGLVVVGVCLQNGPPKGPKPPRMQREVTLLSPVEPSFCPSTLSASPALASIAAPFAALARAIIPARSSFQFVQTGERVPRVGGGALDFSKFAPVLADPIGEITWDFVEPKNLRVGQTFGFTVTARTGAGTPVELVDVEAYTAGNSGFPAGAELQPDGNRFGVTSELDGSYTFSGLTLTKTGGYRICVKGTLEGFQFTPACSQLFNVRK